RLAAASTSRASHERQVAELIEQTAESLRAKIIINRVCRQVSPPQGFMNEGLRKELAGSGASQDQVRAAVLERLMTQDDVRDRIDALWADAEDDVSAHAGADLVAIAPGEEILDAVSWRSPDATTGSENTAWPLPRPLLLRPTRSGKSSRSS